MSSIIVDEKVIVLDQLSKISQEGASVQFEFYTSKPSYTYFYNDSEDQAKSFFIDLIKVLSGKSLTNFLFIKNVIYPTAFVQLIERQNTAIVVNMKDRHPESIYFDNEDEAKEALQNILKGYGYKAPIAEIDLIKQ